MNKSLQDEEVAKNKKKQLGDTKHFCPVAFKEKFVLWPGNPEVGSKYRERVYYFANQDNKDKLMATPTPFVAKGKPFTVRLWIIDWCLIPGTMLIMCEELSAAHIFVKKKHVNAN